MLEAYSSAAAAHAWLVCTPTQLLIQASIPAIYGGCDTCGSGLFGSHSKPETCRCFVTTVEEFKQNGLLPAGIAAELAACCCSKQHRVSDTVGQPSHWLPTGRLSPSI